MLTTTPGHSLSRWGHLCPGLPWKIGVPTIFRTSRFSVTSLFVTLTRRGFKIQQILRNLRKLGAATICRILRFFVTFLLFLYLPWRRFGIQQILRKLREIVVATICRTVRFFVTSLLFSIGRRGLPISTNPSKSAKNRPPLYYFSLYIFITSQKGRCKTHSACIAFTTLLHSHWILQSSWHFSRSFGAQRVL